MLILMTLSHCHRDKSLRYAPQRHKDFIKEHEWLRRSEEGLLKVRQSQGTYTAYYP